MMYETHTAEETKSIAANLASSMKGGEVIELRGELGAGKTTFVQGFVGALGYTDPVRSPTFSLMNIYPVNHGSIKEIVHLDLYRLEDASELRGLALEDWLGRKDVVVLIEWPKFENIVQWKPSVRVKIETISEQIRKIIVETYGER
jgi:tRNA threonylcarbamoyladenosine biosynthesis protein TsaE